MSVYQKIRQLGEGGQSKVWLVQKKGSSTDTENQPEYAAMKKLSSTLPDGLREADILKKLHHPAFPAFLGIVEEEGQRYLLMEYIDGENLRDKLEQEGKQNQRKVYDWAEQLCGMFLYLEKQTPPIIYRDLKPGNLILTKNGMLRLIDFGSAREFREGAQEDTVFLGTRGYAAPELYGQMGQSSTDTDIFGFGMTIYHMLTGISPAKLTGPVSSGKTDGKALFTGIRGRMIPGCWKKLICKAVSPEREKRYRSFLEIGRELEYWKRRDRFRIAGILALVFCLLFAGIHEGEQIAIRKNSEKIKELEEEILSDGKLTEQESRTAEQILDEMPSFGGFCGKSLSEWLYDQDKSAYVKLMFRLGLACATDWNHRNAALLALWMQVPVREGAGFLTEEEQNEAEILYLIGCYYAKGENESPGNYWEELYDCSGFQAAPAVSYYYDREILLLLLRDAARLKNEGVTEAEIEDQLVRIKKNLEENCPEEMAKERQELSRELETADMLAQSVFGQK